MRRSVLLIGLTALVAGCGSDDGDSLGAVPEVTPTSSTTATESTAVPATTASMAPATEPTVAPSPTTTEPSIVSTTIVTPPDATDGTAIVYATAGDPYAWLPVGWWDGTEWGSVEWPDHSLVLPAATYDSVSVASVQFQDGPKQGLTDFTPAQFGCIDAMDIPSIELEVGLPESQAWWGYRAVGVTGADWNVHPRPVSAVGLDAPEYQQLGESLVPTDEPVDPSVGDVTQVFRVDLDGDGIEEVLFTFEHVDPGAQGMPVFGEFSIVAARYPDASGDVVDDVVYEHVVPQTMDFPDVGRARVAAILDVNGDGTMEVAITSVGWESAGITVFEFRDGALHQVMTSACGS